MGISDKYHFEWQNSIASDLVSTQLISRESTLAPLCLGEMQDPQMFSALKNQGVRLGKPLCIDVQNDGSKENCIHGDINSIANLSSDSFDLVTLFRSSYFIEDKNKFLSNLSRILRPGGLAFIDWLHGSSDAPVVGFGGGGPVYDGIERLFRTTYLDNIFIDSFSDEFEALFRHINRPPRTGRFGAIRAILDKPINNVTLVNYYEKLSRTLAERDFELITDLDIEEYGLDITYRSARYFYPDIRKFNLYIFTCFQKRYE